MKSKIKLIKLGYTIAIDRLLRLAEMTHDDNEVSMTLIKLGYIIAIDRLLRLAEMTHDDTEQRVLFLAAEELARRYNIKISEELQNYDIN